MPPFDQLVRSLQRADCNANLRDILRGVEKESLRVTPEGALAHTPHPPGLGSALSHSHITTDYSEALLEFITQPFNRVDDLLTQLDEIHQFTYGELGDELLWPASMPCSLGGDADIPVARYGSSNAGAMKTIYRLGLGHRYGRAMQTIAGIHYNFSLPDALWRTLQRQDDSNEPLQAYKTRRYFDLIRNFRRYTWLLIYLFGASPAVCRSFVRNRAHQLVPFDGDQHSLHSPWATSLRMGDLGYQSDAQGSLIVCYNDLETYIQTLCGAITRPHPDYQAIGITDSQGNYQQLNAGLLQIENEFYSSVRPKRTTRPGETALQALRLRGVEYIEVRCLDLDPEQPLGIGAEQIHFLDSFLLFCLLQDSPRTDDRQYRNEQENQKRIVYRGRDPALTLRRDGDQVPLRDWAASLMEQVAHCAALLDQAYGGEDHARALAAQQAKLADAQLTPSARVLAQMRAQRQTFFRYTLGLAEGHKNGFAGRPLAPHTQARYRKIAKDSLARQAQIEAQEQLPFEQHLANYYAQYQDCACATSD